MKILKFNEDIIIETDFRSGDLNKYKKLNKTQFKDVLNNYYNIRDIIKEYLITYDDNYIDIEITFEKFDSYDIDIIEIASDKLIIQVTDYTSENYEIVIELNSFLKFYNDYDISLKTKKYNL